METRQKVIIIWTHRHTRLSDCSIWTTNVVGKYLATTKYQCAAKQRCSTRPLYNSRND